MTRPTVLDASALLAVLLEEEGSEEVQQAILAGATMSAVNLAEVLGKFADRGEDPVAVARFLAEGGVLPKGIRVVPFDGDSARETARIRRATTGSGLSLGDRACLALARSLAAPALTTDRAWARLRVGVKVRVLR